nr:immunoglobulin light chain junction region [Macaca mulatta]
DYYCSSYAGTNSLIF